MNNDLETRTRLPRDWKSVELKTIASIRTGPFGTLLQASEYVEHNGVPMISVGEVRDGFIRVTEETPRIPESVCNRLPQYVLKKGDIVFGRKGGVDRSALITEVEDGWFLGSDGIAVHLEHGYSAAYVALQFRGQDVRSWLLQNAIGTTMPSLNQAILGSVVIPLPPTPAEQEAIAEALGDADALIESLEQLVAKKRQLKQAAMQELLTGKTRLPGFESEWIPIRLGDLGRTYGGLTGKTKVDFGSGNGSYVTFMNVMTNTQVDSAMHEKVAIKKGEVQNRVQIGDLLLNGSSETPEEVGMCCYVSEVVADLYLNSFCFGFRPFDFGSVDGLFFAYLLRSPVGRSLVKSLAQGATRYNLSKTALLKLRVHLPDIREQAAIADVLSDMDLEIEALEARLAKARLIKQGMMQELLTGRIRLV